MHNVEDDTNSENPKFPCVHTKDKSIAMSLGFTLCLQFPISIFQIATSKVCVFSTAPRHMGLANGCYLEKLQKKKWILLLKSQWLVTLCISHLLQAARMEQWENQTSRLRNLACYSCIEHRNCQLDSHSFIYSSLWTNSILLSLFLGSIVVIKKSSATHRKEFFAKISPKLNERKKYHIQRTGSAA